MKRRDFFRLMGIASGAVLTACNTNDADKKILPYLVPPGEGIIPGVARYLCSTCMECPAHCGLSIKIREDKPVKLEGNENHPINQGALCIRGQASLARVYHPGRLSLPLLRSGNSFKEISWLEAIEKLRGALSQAKGQGKRCVYVSSRTSGLLSTLKDEFCQEMGIERWKEIEMFHHGGLRTANEWLFGKDSLPYYRIDASDGLVTLGADLLETFISPVEWSRQIVRARLNPMFKWVHGEPGISLTGVSADERRVIRPGSEPYLLAYLLWQTAYVHRQAVPDEIMTLIPDEKIETVARETGLKEYDLKIFQEVLEKAKKPLIISGGLAVTGPNGLITALYTGLLQWALGMTGSDRLVNDSTGTGESVVDFSCAFRYQNVGTCLDMQQLVDACAGDQIGLGLFSRLYGLETPVIERIKRVGFKVIMAETRSDVTMALADMVLPLANPLESWGDVSPRQGLQSILQPAMTPFKEAKSEGDILLSLLGRSSSFQEYLGGYWQKEFKDGAWFENGVKESRPVVVLPILNEVKLLEELKRMKLTVPCEPGRERCLLVMPSLRVFDRRSGDIALLHEIPDPLVAVSYGKWLSISPGDAGALGIGVGEIVKMNYGAGTLRLPVVINPGIPGGVVIVSVEAITTSTLPLDGITGQRFQIIKDINIEKTGKHVSVAKLTGAYVTGKRSILPGDEAPHDHTNHKHHEHNQRRLPGEEKIPRSLYPVHHHKEYRWGMAIDLDACSGCSACVAACYIENNIAVVGQVEHIRGREMAWLRIEPYYNDPGRPGFIPMMCQHCDYAPCETVCPVYATYHNDEGLNAQVYNRCVGTRYCANNCPYKARRFNWYDHVNQLPLYTGFNPECSVRPRGVMEKCSFCIQRIRNARDRAKDEGRLLRDGEVMPACAQTCPMGAITFGNLLDPGSRVSLLIKEAGIYRIQEFLGTEPAVYYLKRPEKKPLSGGA